METGGLSITTSLFFYFTVTREPSLTFVVDLEADGANALVRLQVEPHLVGHAHDQVRNEAAREAGECMCVWGGGGRASDHIIVIQTTIFTSAIKATIKSGCSECEQGLGAAMCWI